MAKRYESGTRHEVMLAALNYAITDRMAIIEAYIDCQDDLAIALVVEARQEIRDFRRMIKRVERQLALYGS